MENCKKDLPVPELASSETKTTPKTVTLPGTKERKIRDDDKS